MTEQSYSADLVPPFVETYMSTVHLIGPGNVANLNVHLIGHATFDANGRLTATVDSWNVDCVQQAGTEDTQRGAEETTPLEPGNRRPQERARVVHGSP